MPLFDRTKTAQQIAENVPLRQALWLVQNGVPFDCAFELDAHELFAWSIIFSEMASGQKFDWDRMEWPQVD